MGMLSLQNSRKTLLSLNKLASFPSYPRRTKCMQACFVMAGEVPALCFMRQAISPNLLHHHPTWSEIYVHLCTSDLNKEWGISCMMMCYRTVGVPGVNDITNSVPCLILCVIMLWTVTKSVVTPQLLSSVGHEVKVNGEVHSEVCPICECNQGNVPSLRLKAGDSLSPWYN